MDNAGNANSAIGSSCTADYVIIAEAGASINANPNSNMFCGAALGRNWLNQTNGAVTSQLSGNLALFLIFDNFILSP